MDTRLRQDYASAAEFDHVKLNFQTTHRAMVDEVREKVDYHFRELVAINPGMKLKKPKYTMLGPAASRPDGTFIVQIWGQACKLVYALPSEWIRYATFVDVKAYTDNPRWSDVKMLGALYMEGQARRTVTYTVGGTQGSKEKGVGVPTLRIGARTSDVHWIFYKRPSANIGLELRFRGDRLLDSAIDVLSHFFELDVPDAAVWRAFRVELATKGAKIFAGDAGKRGVNLRGFTDTFMTYDEMKEVDPVQEAIPALMPARPPFDPDTGEII